MWRSFRKVSTGGLPLEPGPDSRGRGSGARASSRDATPLLGIVAWPPSRARFNQCQSWNTRRRRNGKNVTGGTVKWRIQRSVAISASS